MLSTAAGKRTAAKNTGEVSRGAGRLFAKKIWLPKLIYSALPYFYLVSGFVAFLATLYISEWFWVLPHYILFSAACMHLGIIVYRRRRQRPEA